MRRKLNPPIKSVYRFADKQVGFIAYLKERYSEYSIYRTIGYIQSPLVSNVVKQLTGKELIYDVMDVDSILKIYRTVHKSEQDIRLHKVYSASVNRYLRYISKWRVYNRQNKSTCECPASAVRRQHPKWRWGNGCGRMDTDTGWMWKACRANRTLWCGDTEQLFSSTAVFGTDTKDVASS